jgi:hypothetical protein
MWETTRATPRPSARPRSRLPGVLLAFLVPVLGACGRTDAPLRALDDPTGEVSVAIRVGKAAAASISRAEIVVTATGMVQIRQNLTISGNTITGTVRGIPAGAGRLFTLNGYDASGTLTYTGSATATIVAGQTAQVAIAVRSTAATGAEPQLKVQGIRVLRGVYYTSGNWSEYGSIGEDARITGEILNSSGTAATNVSITVTLRDSGGALLGRASNYSVGTIPGGSSVMFSVFIQKVFPYADDIGTPKAEVTIDG